MRSVHYYDPTREKKVIPSQRKILCGHTTFGLQVLLYSHDCTDTYCNRVLHISHAAVELGEVELWAIGEGEGEVPTCPTCIKCCFLTILTVAQYTSMVPPYRNTLEDMGYGVCTQTLWLVQACSAWECMLSRGKHSLEPQAFCSGFCFSAFGFSSKLQNQTAWVQD